jgi:hypothetical protein
MVVRDEGVGAQPLIQAKKVVLFLGLRFLDNHKKRNPFYLSDKK